MAPVSLNHLKTAHLLCLFLILTFLPDFSSCSETECPQVCQKVGSGCTLCYQQCPSGAVLNYCETPFCPGSQTYKNIQTDQLITLCPEQKQKYTYSSPELCMQMCCRTSEFSQATVQRCSSAASRPDQLFIILIPLVSALGVIALAVCLLVLYGQRLQKRSARPDSDLHNNPISPVSATNYKQGNQPIIPAIVHLNDSQASEKKLMRGYNKFAAVALNSNQFLTDEADRENRTEDN